MTSGIYAITNLINGKRYIGSTVDFVKRKSQHLRQLTENCHYNAHLQNAWNKYGSDAFIFARIKECDSDRLLELEEFLINFLQTNKKEFGYNLRKVASSNAGMDFKRYSEGASYNRWTLVRRADDSRKWICRCQCGTEKILDPYHIKKGVSKSCGCYNRELASQLMIKQHADPEWSKRHRERASLNMTKTQARLRENQKSK